MLIAGYLRKDFIEESFKLSDSHFERLLSLLKNEDYIFLIHDPSNSFSDLFKSFSSENYQSRIDKWKFTILETFKKGRYFKDPDNKIITASKPKEQKNIKNFSDKELFFYIKSLTGKVSLFSNSFTKDNDLLHDIKPFSDTLENFAYDLINKISQNNKKINFEKKFKNEIESIKDKNTEDWEKFKLKQYNHIFYEKIAGYLVFNDTAIIFDRFIYEPCIDKNGKPTKNSILRISKYLSESPRLKNLIIIAPDFWNIYKVKQKYQNTDYKVGTQKDVINSYINSIHFEFNRKKRNISVNFFLAPNSIFKEEHERYIAFTNLDKIINDFELDDFATKNDFVSLQFGQGFDYFNDNPNKKSKITYCQHCEFKELIDEIINNNVDDYQDKTFQEKSKYYWSQRYGDKSKIWIHHNQILYG